MREMLTLIFPYYKNTEMLLRQLEHLAGLPKQIRKCLDVIVVDDGSPAGFEARLPITKFTLDRCGGKMSGRTASEMVDDAVGLSFRLFEIEIDVRWNWIAARNIAAYHADTAWVLMTDIDHIIPVETFEHFFGKQKDFDESNAYQFTRVELVRTADGSEFFRSINPHPNTWLFTVSTFNAAGGYDERFSGHYGTDGEFKRRILATTGNITLLPDLVVRVGRDIIVDADTVDYKRKTPEDAENVARIKREIAKNPRGIIRRSFPYHEVNT